MVDFLTDSPKPPPSRITLTLDVLNSSRHCIFAAAGGGKSKVLGEVFSKVLEEEDVVEGRRNLKVRRETVGENKGKKGGEVSASHPSYLPRSLVAVQCQRDQLSLRHG